MAFKQVNIKLASAQGYSVLPTAPVLQGKVTLVSGEAWVRLLATATVSTDGTNSALSAPSPTVGYVNGWQHLSSSSGQTVIDFGASPTTDTTPRDPVAQVDIYLVSSSELNVLAH